MSILNLLRFNEPPFRNFKNVTYLISLTYGHNGTTKIKSGHNKMKEKAVGVGKLRKRIERVGAVLTKEFRPFFF